jgi:hypothetical protein
MAQRHAMRGQAATEFFINYGWAIVIVLAIMAVLYSTIFKPEFYVAERCDIAPGIVCDNFKLEPAAGGNVVLTLQAHNTMGFAMKPESFNFTMTDPMGGAEITSGLTGGVGVSYSGDRLQDGDSFSTVVSFPVGVVAAPGTLYRIKFSMNFSNQALSPATYHRTAGVVNVRLSG